MGIALFAVMLMASSQGEAPAAPKPATDQRGSNPQSPIPDPGSPVPGSPVSVERIREGLQRPTLKIPPIESMPVFRVTVEAEAPLDNPLQGMRRELAENPTGVGGRLGGFDVLGAVMGIVKSIKSAYRTHAEAEIRKEVQAALNAFCTEHDCSILEDGPPPLEGIVLPRKAR